MRDAVGERVGLAGAGAGDDQQRGCVIERAAAVLDGAALLGVELGEIGSGHCFVQSMNEAIRRCARNNRLCQAIASADRRTATPPARPARSSHRRRTRGPALRFPSHPPSWLFKLAPQYTLKLPRAM